MASRTTREPADHDERHGRLQGTIDVFLDRTRAVTELMANVGSGALGKVPEPVPSTVMRMLSSLRQLAEQAPPVTAELEVLVDEVHAKRLSIQALQAELAVLDRHSSLALHDKEVYVNVVGGWRIDEPGCDLAVALAVASSHADHPLGRLAAWGEIGLAGEVRGIPMETRRIEELDNQFGAQLTTRYSTVETLEAELRDAEAGDPFFRQGAADGADLVAHPEGHAERACHGHPCMSRQVRIDDTIPGAERRAREQQATSADAVGERRARLGEIEQDAAERRLGGLFFAGRSGDRGNGDRAE